MGERLKQEVELPAKNQGGLGIMLIASACMFFAVSSSALMLKSNRRHHCPSRYTKVVTVPVAAPAFVAPRKATSECGTPVVQARGEEVVFRLCQ